MENSNTEPNYSEANSNSEGWNIPSPEQNVSDEVDERIAGIVPPDGYQLDSEGVWLLDSKKGPQKISGPAWVGALTRQSGQKCWGKIVCFIDADGEMHELPIPSARLHEPGLQFAQMLAEQGLEIVPGRERSFATYLGKFKPDSRKKCVDRLGWEESGDGNLSFVLPDDVVGNRYDDQVVFQPERYSPTVSTMQAMGTLEQWQENVAGVCSECPFLIFALCVALSAPLLKHARLDSFGFNLYGRSSHGKTTAAQVAASVWGCGADPADAPDQALIRRWNTTANAFESLAAAHNDGVMILDELGTCSARDFGLTIYNVLGGQGKNAMDASRNLKKQRSWRILLLSTGEVSVRQKIEEDGTNRKAKAGQLLRLIDIPIGNDVIQLQENPKAFVEQLKRDCGNYYGTAGRAFIAALIKELENAAGLRDTLRELIDSAERGLMPQRAEIPEVARVTSRFALVEAAGTLAVVLGILPFSEQAVAHAVKYVHSIWLGESTELPDIERAIAAIRDFILRYRDSRLKLLQRDSNETGGTLYPSVRDCAGYWDSDSGLFLLTTDAFKEACGGHDYRQVAKELAKRELLFNKDKDHRRLASKFYIPELKLQSRFYGIREAILEYEPQEISLGKKNIPPSQ